jgi:D-3-phosphoglycerate dehydrogenase
LFTGVRFLHDSNRNMPLEGDTHFEELKKAYAKGIELRGKTLGIIGMGRIGKAVARMAVGLGMKVIYSDMHIPHKDLKIHFFDGQTISISLTSQSLESLFKESDFITLHVPAQDNYVIGEKDFELMKEGVGIINCARGGAIDEVALIEALDSGKVLFAGLDVYENEPNPEITILMNPKISLTPHIGAATEEAQDRIGTELAHQIIQLLN